MQKDLKEGFVSELKPIREGMKNLPRAITFHKFPSTTAYDDYDDEEEVDVFIRHIAEQYLRKFASASKQIKHLNCAIRMVSFTLGTRQQ